MSYQPIDQQDQTIARFVEPTEADLEPIPPVAPTGENGKAFISQGRVIFLAVGMVATGSLNTLSTKWADSTHSEDTWDTRVDDKGHVIESGGQSPEFTHPLLQALGMFIGESLCLLVYFAYVWNQKRKGETYEKPNQGFNPFLFVLPACCDLAATSMMYIGLAFTYASVYQMLRGAVIIFTGVLSVLFLKRKLRPFHWIGMAVILGGLATVGIASLDSSKPAKNPVLGDILVVSSQLIAAFQMVVEEKFLDGYNVPSLMAVGLEGVFGTCIMFVLMFPFYYIPINITTQGYMENALDAFVQMRHSWIIIVASLGNIFSIAFFNYFGVTVTKNLSATTRMVLDSVRTMVIWGVSLAVGWENFSYLQIIGFTILISGTAIYYQYLNYSQLQRALVAGHCMKQHPDMEKDTPIEHVTTSSTHDYTRLEDGTGNEKVINKNTVA